MKKLLIMEIVFLPVTVYAGCLDERFNNCSAVKSRPGYNMY